MALDTEKAQSAVDKIGSFLRFGSILGLERMNDLLDLLGNPQDDLKVIHVAGTNGKGSTCRYIYCTLKAAGYKVGLYTSPYLEVFNERIEVDGQYISDDELSVYTDRVLEQVQIMVDSGKQSPTEFEVVTAIALLYYKEKNCDYVILEVGLGGRGDSTNVVKSPLATIITSISYDHMDRLGNTLTEIAGEKAGIIKDGCPVIVSAESEEALTVLRRVAKEHHAPYYETKDMTYEIVEKGLCGYRFHGNILGHVFENLEISMIGEHQIKNAMGALAALCVLKDGGHLELPDEAIYEGFRTACQKGRLEVIRKPAPGTAGSASAPGILIDGAHNEDGARALRAAAEEFLPGSRILMVVGILADKDVDGMLRHFTAITKDFIVTEPENPRKMEAAELSSKIEAMGGICTERPAAEDAVRLALEQAGIADAGGAAEAKADRYDVVIFAGSLYLIGHVRTLLTALLAPEKMEE